MGFFDDRQKERSPENKQRQPETLLGSIASVAGFVKSHNIQQIYIALPMSAQPRILALLDDLHDTVASIYFVPDIFLFDLIQANISTIKGIPVVAVCESPFVGINGAIKRFSDVVLSLTILLLVAPVMLLIVLGIKLNSRGTRNRVAFRVVRERTRERAGGLRLRKACDRSPHRWDSGDGEARRDGIAFRGVAMSMNRLIACTN
jgi:hypothetical protein